MKHGEDGERRYDLEDRLLEYAARMMKLCESLPTTMGRRHVSGQLLRSGTAPLSHHGEAQAAESPEDFRHKMKLALKELKESWRWLRLIERAVMIGKSDRLGPLLKETDELIRIFATSIKTSQTNSTRSRGKKP
jgi:four helix bundle protein